MYLSRVEIANDMEPKLHNTYLQINQSYSLSLSGISINFTSFRCPP